MPSPPPIRLLVRSHFDAAHRLREYKGACSRLHGHRWEVLVEVVVTGRDRIGMAADFKVLKGLINACLPDHECLNDLSWFQERNPTAENLLPWLVGRLRRVFANTPGKLALASLQLWESPDCSVLWRVGDA